MIRTEHVSKVYQNGFKAVDDLNLRVGRGDIFGYLGPNGAGKTTTIRMLTGLHRPTTGNVFVDGKNVVENPIDVKSIIGVVPESHGYYNWMNPYEYLCYFGALFGMDKSKTKIHAGELLEKVGLADKTKVPVGEFSRGMKQRLGIAKALINRPKVIFLDEPTLGLDPLGQRDVQKLILDINRTDGITVFITSHLLKDIEVLCNKVCIVQNGVMVEQGTIRELKDKYLSEDIIRIKSSDNIKALELIEANLELSGMEVSGEHLNIQLGGSLEEKSKVKNKILQMLLESSIAVDEITHEEPDMEEIFFKVTERKGGAA